MNKMDVHILPVYRATGTHISNPGLYVAVPPRRVARGRKAEQLILYLFQSGRKSLSGTETAEILQKLATMYYQSRGSMTAVMRDTAQSLNDYLMARNLRSTEQEGQAVGIFSQIVIKEGRLSIAQSGPANIWTWRDRKHTYVREPQLAGKGLGISRTTPIYFNQFEFVSGDLVVVSTGELPQHIVDESIVLTQDRIPALVSAMTEGLQADVNKLIISVSPGEGAVHLLEPGADIEAIFSMSAYHMPDKIDPVKHDREQSLPQEIYNGLPIERADRIEVGDARSAALEDYLSIESSGDAMLDRQEREPVHLSSDDSLDRDSVIARPQQADMQEEISKTGASLQLVLSRVGSFLRGFLPKLARVLQAFVGRMLPGDGIFTLPRGFMAISALVVPLVVVAVASLVYFGRGRSSQFQAYFEQAQSAAVIAAAQTELMDIRTAWEATLAFLDQAEAYETTAESQALRTHALSVLDEIDGIVRLDFQPAIVGGLSRGTHISQIVATEGDLYLLDSSQGSVIRASLTSRGYEIDSNFRCGPGPYGPYIVEEIIDIAALPRGNEQRASLIGMDANGNLLYCIPGEAPLSAPLAPPDSNWGNPAAMVLDLGDLYILDPFTNAVWIFPGTAMSFRERPELYFGAEVPNLADVIDLAVNGDDLYLLHQGGQMTTCTRSLGSEDPTRCTAPAEFTDNRPGKQNGNIIMGTNIAQLQFVPPPEPSIYMLDPDSQSVYHLSLRLNLQRQYRSANRLPDEAASTFAVSPNRMIFLALGNTVYFARIP